ncbi:hypothetical protein [Cetobacterium somerae]|uniref:Uncharacterized protein n=1 Tax=Cetobacterium somerae ATCC BAA-474 TaxID=1319815 RepID=U7V1W1_9FUSO|nr:hypothetical protein [Cetobacterium somerae]ERT65575.1 hypothetical protein HMPREF0202_02771 [Cetobacterium somerae ATCC BAA-474]
MIKEISLDIAESIKESLLVGNLTNEVHLKIGDYEINIDNLENSIIDENNELMEKTTFTFRGFPEVLNKGKQIGELFFSIGQWRDEKSYRFVDTHIVLGAKMIHNFFSQIDLSDAVEDKENIYLLKNISSKAGRGAIVRLYTGKGSFSAEERVAKLLENYRDQTIERNSKKWIKVCIINKKLLEKTQENRSILLTKFVEDFLRFSFLVEEIREL